MRRPKVQPETVLGDDVVRKVLRSIEESHS